MALTQAQLSWFGQDVLEILLQRWANAWDIDQDMGYWQRLRGSAVFRERSQMTKVAGLNESRFFCLRRQNFGNSKLKLMKCFLVSA